jgi:TolB protein
MAERRRWVPRLAALTAAVGAAAIWPAASPAAFSGRDGLIVFSSASGAQSLLAVTAAGDGLTALTTCFPETDRPCGGSEPAWSRDGRRIAFRRADEIWVMNADGGGGRALEGVAGGEPAWSPGGRWIAFTALGYKGSYGIAVVRADGSRGRVLTTTIRDASPTWSPDGRRIAFTRFRDAPRGGQDIYTISPSGTGRGRLIGGCFCTSPDYSPDGRHIAFDAGRTAQIYVATSKGKNRRRLTSQIGADPAWSPSGRYIAFARGDDLYVMRRDGSEQRRIPYRRRNAPEPDREARWEHPTWQPRR